MEDGNPIPSLNSTIQALVLCLSDFEHVIMLSEMMAISPQQLSNPNEPFKLSNTHKISALEKLVSGSSPALSILKLSSHPSKKFQRNANYSLQCSKPFQPLLSITESLLHQTRHNPKDQSAIPFNITKPPKSILSLPNPTEENIKKPNPVPPIYEFRCNICMRMPVADACMN